MSVRGRRSGDTINLVATTTTALLTVEEFRSLPDNGMWQELVEGELLEMPPPDVVHSRTWLALLFSLRDWAKQTGSTLEPMAETAFTLSENPPTVRVPDACLVRADRVGGLTGGYIRGAPELAIEVVSPSNTVRDLGKKVDQYLEFGSMAVLVVDPRRGRVELYTQSPPARVFEADDTVTVPDIAPGWSIKVSDLL